MKKFAFSALLIGFALGIGLGLLWAGESSFKVVVNSENPVDSMARDEVSKLFLKKVGSWAHGMTVLPVDQLGTAEVREKFSKEIHGKSVATMVSPLPLGAGSSRAEARSSPTGTAMAGRPCTTACSPNRMTLPAAEASTGARFIVCRYPIAC